LPIEDFYIVLKSGQVVYAYAQNCKYNKDLVGCIFSTLHLVSKEIGYGELDFLIFGPSKYLIQAEGDVLFVGRAPSKDSNELLLEQIDQLKGVFHMFLSTNTKSLTRLAVEQDQILQACYQPYLEGALYKLRTSLW
jgi:hypothetical protein